MKLIADWRQSWRLWSVRVSALGSLIFAFLLAAPDQVLAIWQALPAEVQSLVPNARELGMLLFVTSLVARMVKQRSHADAA